MMRAVVGALAILVVSALGDVVSRNTETPKVVNHVTLQRQIDLSGLFNHITEPIKDPELKAIAETWDWVKNIENFNNMTAVKEFMVLEEHNLLMPRMVLFKPNAATIQYEITTLFNMLYSAKDYPTFFKTAVYLRERLNEAIFVYVLSVVIMQHPETKDIIVPPIYEVFPMYFHNAEIMNIARRVNVHGKRFVKNYSQTYIWDDNVVIRWNTTVWPYVDEENTPLSYYLNDYALNTLKFNNHIRNPNWLSDNVSSLNRNKWGAFNWFFNKQFVTRYYMERLSHGFGEIPLLNWDVVKQGYSSGLVHYNGVPFPVRPNYFKLEQPKVFEHIEQLKQYESRVREAIDMGYLISMTGEKINLRDPEAIGVLMNVVEGNVHSPNSIYYGSILNAWKELLGNSIVSTNVWWKGHVPLVLPAALDLTATELRDPAFYMIWKRIINLFTLWQSYLPLYQQEELALPEVKIQKVEVAKLVTYFEQNYLNVTNALPQNDVESKGGAVSVLVQHPVLNNKVFKVRVHVKSDVPKTVVVKFFLAPKYNSKGLEIPLQLNTENFFQLDQFIYELPVGETVINRDSTSNTYMMDKYWSCTEITTKAVNALHGKSQFVVDLNNFSSGFPRHIMLPRGRVGGMPFQFLVYINEYKPTTEPFGTYAGLGALSTSGGTWGYPLDRPLHEWQIKKLTNIHIDEVQIYHKPTPEIVIPYTM